MSDLTVFEEILMTTILRLKDNAYGVTIRKTAEAVTKRRVIYGTLYNTLHQLWRKGLVTKERGKPESRQGGRSKIFYSITRSGLEALTHSRDLHRNIWDGLPDPLTEKK